MPVSAGDARDQIVAGREMLGWSEQTLWFAYVGLGGSDTLDRLREYLNGADRLPDYELAVLAAALNDEFTGRGSDHPIRLGPGSDPT